jgi:hypothetical protein
MDKIERTIKWIERIVPKLLFLVLWVGYMLLFLAVVILVFVRFVLHVDVPHLLSHLGSIGGSPAR